MSVLTIREHATAGGVAAATGSAGFQALLCIDGGEDHAITVSNPFAAEDEARLEWYFEEHLRQPYLHGVKAREAAQSVKHYGERLFDQIFAPRDAYAEYSALKSQLGQLRIEIEGSPAFQALHWEALKDPALPHAFSVDAEVVRRRRSRQALPAQVRQAPALRLLIVTARPNGAGDVGYRTISRPLVETLRQAQLTVDIDILRPGTYKALDQHLRDITQLHGAGFYHIIHFDTHGALLEHAQLQAAAQPGAPSGGRHAFRRYGRAELQPYEGSKAFLFLEDDAGKDADALEAGELATLLTTHQIPIVVLNACQSGKQVGSSETSLGSRLIEAGVQVVLAMGYSVTVSAAEILMASLYQQLFAGKELAQAIRHGRQELYNHKGRRAYFNREIELEDWLLPVVYQNRSVRLQPVPFTPEEEAHYLERQAAAFPAPQTTFGFFGRDLDTLEIERRLLRRNLLLVHGMGGAGKTTLLRHLGHWWQSTDFVGQVFYFGYDEKGWTRQQILHAVAQKLLPPTEYHGSFLALKPALQQLKLAKVLAAQRHLVILDNLESVTGTHLAIAHGLNEPERQELHELLKVLQGGKTMVLLGSRSPEPWLAPQTFEKNIHELRGLDPEAASQLAEDILEYHQLSGCQQDPDFERLLRLLDGFPLALEVVLANLTRQSAGQILEALGEGADLAQGDAESRTRNILRCIEYSHSNLSPDAQALLACLAPFSGVINTDWLQLYTEALKAQPPLAGLPFDRWPEVLQ